MDDLKSLGELESLLSGEIADLFGDGVEFFFEVDFVKEPLDGGGAFAELGSGVFGDEGAVREEVEGLGRILHLADELVGFELVGAAFRDIGLESVDDVDEFDTGDSLIQEVLVFKDARSAGVQDDVGGEIDDFLELLRGDLQN